MTATALIDVDVVILLRPGDEASPQVLHALQNQRGVRAIVHLHTGSPQPGDSHRRMTIARARNQGKRLGTAPWFMFVDDDVILAPDCIETLINTLTNSPALGAVGVRYGHPDSPPGHPGHVAMGATLFRRSVLQQFEFKGDIQLCECWHACLDLRRQNIGIQYCDATTATQIAPEIKRWLPPTVLAAFDRRDLGRFEHQFLRTLRAHGNREQVIAVGYGLYPSERRRIEQLPGVDLHWRPNNGEMVPVRRIVDFARVLEQISPRTQVAYWDVADVVFQDSLQDLWQTIEMSDDRLLAVIEPKGYPLNGVIRPWSLSIHSPSHRQRAFELLKTNPFLNSGFAAGTARAMLPYFLAAAEMRYGPALRGTTDWGDQMCLNLYCHQHPERWRFINHRWNYCVHDRAPGDVFITPQGVISSRRGDRISVAHGNARSLRQLAIVQRP